VTVSARDGGALSQRDEHSVGRPITQVDPQLVGAHAGLKGLGTPVEDVPVAIGVVAEEIARGGSRRGNGFRLRSRYAIGNLGHVELSRSVAYCGAFCGEAELHRHYGAELEDGAAVGVTDLSTDI
jgi:hypothetical protein